MDPERKPRFDPEDIRMLRGKRSRAELARLLGVTPLTVYRWELPPEAEQSRRPRGAIARRLAEIAERGEAGAPSPASGSPATSPSDRELAPSPAMDVAEQAELLPLLERFMSGDLHRVENELLAQMASGRLGTPAGRAMAAQALARTVLLARADTVGAFAMIAPLLPDASRLPGFVELEIHVTAALVFSWPDGRFYDVGRANTHLAHAARLLPLFGTPGVRFLLDLARVTLALELGQPEPMAAAIAQAAALEQVVASPLLSTLLHEAEGHLAAAQGRPAEAARAFQLVAETGSVAVSRVRALGQLASRAIHDARPPREALTLVERARALALQARLQPGLHTMMLDNVEAYAHSRLGQFADAKRVLGASIALAEELRWSPALAAMWLARVLGTTGQPDAMRALGGRLAAYDGTTAVGLTRALGAMLIAAADLLGEPRAGVERGAELERRIEEVEQEAGWHELRGEVALAGALLTTLAGTPEQAAHALRRVERYYERFPSLWSTAMLRRTRGMLLARQGRLREARQLVESALATLTLAEDVGDAAYARFLLALIGCARLEPGAQEELARTGAELQRLGFSGGAAVGLRFPPESAPQFPGVAGDAPGGATPVDRLVVPLQRLAVRGMSPALIQRELVSLAAECVPGATACLEEIDSAGRATLLQRVGPEAPRATQWVELSDGAGRRLRLAVGGSPAAAEARPVLATLSVFAEMALELAVLRSTGGQRSAAAGAGQVGELPDIPGFISVSAPMRQLKADLVRLSRSRSTVIIGGESGAGKEVVARAIHELSTRAGKPYVAFNCAAVPRDLFEGQLFGYRKGAFTGAGSDHPGVLRSAEGGTVLLDEIGELPLDVQPKLLRFLENGEIFPLGERKPLRLDVRVIAATFRDLEELVRERRFREDLFYRLQVVPLRVPPLRERPDDIVALARHFVSELTPEGQEPPVLAPDALAALNAHRWPGNVRELRNVMERSLAFAPLPPVLGAEHLRITA